MSGIVKTGQAVGLDGHLATDNEVKRSTIFTVLFGFTPFGFILGSLVSMIPYKQLPYSKKYVYFSLISILILHIIMFILGIRNLILF